MDYLVFNIYYAQQKNSKSYSLLLLFITVKCKTKKFIVGIKGYTLFTVIFKKLFLVFTSLFICYTGNDLLGGILWQNKNYYL